MNARKNLLDKKEDELALFLEQVDGYENSFFLMKTDTYKQETTQQHRIYY